MCVDKIGVRLNFYFCQQLFITRYNFQIPSMRIDINASDIYRLSSLKYSFHAFDVFDREEENDNEIRAFSFQRWKRGNADGEW